MFFKRSPKQAPKEDAELLILYQQTEDLAYLGELFDRYIHLVYGICLKYLKGQEESKDMAMQVFEKLAVQLKQNEVKNFKSWLHVLTKNECLMLLRTQKYKVERANLTIYPDDGMDFSLNMHHQEDEKLESNLQDLELAIKELPTEQKQCIKLFFFQQKCYKEIVELTGYELNKVKSYIQNGKRNLKIHLQKLDE
ncbi:sigma-70 family RNA polymerase sigma factor [soil metagenome]